MIYETKKIQLKNGQEAVLRSPSASDGTQMLEVLKRLSAETDFLLRYPEEWTITAEQEAGYLEGLNRSQNDLMIVCTVDGDPSEWSEEDVVLEAGSGSLSMKYDEKYLYFYAEDPAYDPEADALYIPIDTTPQSGSPYCENYDISFERACDFILCIDGRTNSRVVVQERYEILWAMHAYDLAREDAYYEPRDLDSPIFRPISVMVQRAEPVPAGTWLPAVTYETGALR